MYDAIQCTREREIRDAALNLYTGILQQIGLRVTQSAAYNTVLPARSHVRVHND